MRYKQLGVVAIIAVNLALLALTGMFAQAQGGAALVGTLSMLHLDGQDGSYQVQYWLTSTGGVRQQIELSATQIGDIGGKSTLNGQEVAITLSGEQRDGAAVVESITPLGTRNYYSAPVGDIHYYVLPCRYSDYSSTPATVSTLNRLYNGTFPSAADYFEKTSHGVVTDMSFTVRGWKNLPNTRNYYMSSPYPFDALFEACVAAHDGDITFTANDGVALLLNGEIHPNGQFAVGGGNYGSMDGIDQVWRAIWMPPWSYNTSYGLQVTVHEIGHSLGWPHSNLSDNDTNPYDNPWDIMSSSYTVSSSANGFGVPKPSNLYHYLDSDWLPAEDIFIPQPNTTTTVQLQAWRATGNTTDSKVHVIDIPLPNQQRITVEASRSGSSYYASGAANGVLIYHVDPYRTEDAWLVGAKDDAAAYTGGVWTVGETYKNKAFNISVAVVSSQKDGFTVTVTRGPEVAEIPILTPESEGFVTFNLDFPIGWMDVPDAAQYIVQVKTWPKTLPKYAYKAVLNPADICEDDVCMFIPNNDMNWLPPYKAYLLISISAKNALNQNVGQSETVGIYYDAFDDFLDAYEPAFLEEVPVNATFGWLWYDDYWHATINEFRLRIVRPDGTVVMNAWRPVTDYTCTQDFEDYKVCRYPVDLSTLKGGVKPGQYKWKVFGRNLRVKGFASSIMSRFTVDLSGRISSPDEIFRAP